jgi:hypothetical protein
LLEGQRPVGAGDDKLTIFESDIGLRRFQKTGGEFARLFDDLLDCLKYRAGPDRRRA